MPVSELEAPSKLDAPSKPIPTPGVAARGLTYEAFAPGQRYISGRRTVTETDVVQFAGLSGDFNPLHVDAIAAAATPFRARIAHGLLVVAISTGLANQLGIFEGTTLALLEQRHRYKGPVQFGDTIHLVLEVAETRNTSKPDRGLVVFNTEIRNQNDDVVIDGAWTLLMRSVGDTNSAEG